MNTVQTLADLNRRFDEEGRDAAPAAVRVARNKVLAESRGLPPSTVAREAILRLFDPGAARSAEATRLIEQFTQFVSEFVPSSGEPLPEPRPTRTTKANFTRTSRRKGC
jgi:hypothetical protein